MSRSVLVAFASRRGSTREVAESIAETLRELGVKVELLQASEVRDLAGYEGVVLGGALYTGRLHGDARNLLKRHRAALRDVPLAVFAMGPRTLADADIEGSREQLDHALAKVPEIEPVSVAIFGGVVDPAKLRFPFNRIPASDARDWDAIRAWAEEICEMLDATEAMGTRASR